MAVGEFADREEALAAAEQLLAVDSPYRLLPVFGVTGQGKTRLLQQIAELHSSRYRPQLIDLQSVVNSLWGANRDKLAGNADDVAVLLLRELGMGLARQARWWQRPARLRRGAEAIGQEPLPRRVNVQLTATHGGVIIDSPPTIRIGDSVRRGVWINQLEGIARKLRRRRLALLVDTCEWMYVFDESPSAEEEHPPGRGRSATISPLVLGQVLPRLLATAPRLKVILAGWDRLEIDPRIRALPACELTGWAAQHTRSFLASAGMNDPAVAALVHQAQRGVCNHPQDGGGGELVLLHGAQPGQDHLRDPAVGRAVTDETRQRGDVDRAFRGPRRDGLLGDHIGQQWQPIPKALLPDHPTGEDWLRRLTNRTFLQKLPSTTTNMRAGAPRWQMHGLIRHWMLDYLANDDAVRPSRDQRLPVLHQRAANYFSQLAAGAPATWSLEVTYHCFAIGDPAPADAWRQQLLAAAHLGDLATVATHVEVALPPEQQDRVRAHLPAVTAVAMAAQAWIAYLRNDLDAAEHLALDAAKLADQVNQPALRAWALRIAGQAAYLNWAWTRARAHWQAAVMITRPTADPAELFPLMAALVEVTVGSGDLPTATALLDETRALPGGEPAPLPASSEIAPPPVRLGSHLLRTDPACRLILLAAKVALRTGQWDRAQALLDEATGCSSNDYLQAETFRVRAELALARYDPPNAARLADTAARTLTTAGNRPELRIATLLTQANAALQLSGYGPPLTASPEWASPGLQAAGQLIPGAPKMFSMSIRDAAEARHQQDLASGYINAALDLALETDNRHGQACALLTGSAADRALPLFTQVGDRRGQANALYELGEIARLRGDFVSAEQYYSAALTLYREIGDRRGQAHAQRGLGEVAQQHDFASAEQHFRQALSISQEIGDRRGQAHVQRGLGETARLQHDLPAAEQYFRHALGTSQEIGDRRGQAHAQHRLGVISRLHDDFASAEQHYGAALTLYREIGDRRGQATTLYELGEVAQLCSDFDAAEQYFRQALSISQEIGDRRDQAHAQLGLATIARQRGDFATAEQHYGAAHTLYREIGDRRGQAHAQRGLGATAGQRGDFVGAERHFRQALSASQEIGDRRGQGNNLFGLGEVAQLRGDFDAAEQYFRQALSISQEIGDRRGHASALYRLGDLARVRGDNTAVLFLTRAAELYETIGLADHAAKARRLIPP